MRVTIKRAFGAVCIGLFCALPGCGDDDEPRESDAGREESKDKPFSFFVTSYAAMQRLSGSQSGFGGDLRYGESTGLAGADKICREIAEGSLKGSGKQKWRAFLSATKGADGKPVHAIDRLGKGPWYDRRGRLLAKNKADLLNPRPLGADPEIVDDFPNELGVPNHAPDGMDVDNHDVLTGTNDKGELYATDGSATCRDWTSSVGSDGKPRVGHSWPRDFAAFGRDGGFPFPGAADGGFPFPFGGNGGFPFPGAADGGFPFPFGGDGGFPFPLGDGGAFDFAALGMVDGVNWMSSLNEAGCAPGASLIEMGPPNPNNPTVGSGGGYGAIYCFAD